MTFFTGTSTCFPTGRDGPEVVRSPVISPTSLSRSHGSSHPSTPVQLAASTGTGRSRVHFASSPASVVEITPYSWTSNGSSPVFESPTSPWNGAMNGSNVQGHVNVGYGAGYPIPATTYAPPAPVTMYAPVMLPLQALSQVPPGNATVPVPVPQVAPVMPGMPLMQAPAPSALSAPSAHSTAGPPAPAPSE